jgi:hypothetical protein
MAMGLGRARGARLRRTHRGRSGTAEGRIPASVRASLPLRRLTTTEVDVLARFRDLSRRRAAQLKRQVTIDAAVFTNERPRAVGRYNASREK